MEPKETQIEVTCKRGERAERMKTLHDVELIFKWEGFTPTALKDNNNVLEITVESMESVPGDLIKKMVEFQNYISARVLAQQTFDFTSDAPAES